MNTDFDPELILIKTREFDVPCNDEQVDPLFSIVSNRKYECRLCEFSTNSMQTIEDHVVGHIDEKLYHSNYECSHCLEWIRSERNLREHFETHFVKEEPEGREECLPPIEMAAVCCPMEPILSAIVQPSLESHEIEESTRSVTPNENNTDVDFSSENDDSRVATFLDTNQAKQTVLAAPSSSMPTKNHFECAICSRMLRSKAALKAHMLYKHSAKNDKKQDRKCSICSKQFTTTNALNVHLKTHTNERSFACDFGGCKETFQRKDHLIRHQAVHTDSPSLVCPHCSGKYRRRDSLMNHVRNKHPDTSFEVCDMCDKKCLTKDELTSHMVKCCPKKFKCTKCKSMFDLRSALRKHEFEVHAVKEDSKSYVACEFCSKHFSSHSLLTKHMRRHTGRFGCALCPETYQRKECLVRHLMIHAGDTPFVCHFNQCEKRFYRKDLLKRHMAKHTGDLKYECYLCKKRFITKFELTVHFMMHTGRAKPKKDILCEICSRTFSQLNQLKVHMMRHSGEKPFACDKCSYRTHGIKILKAHIKTHNEKSEAGFQCGECLKKFATKSTLKIHMIRHTGNKQFECQTCSTKYYTQLELQNHINSIHKGERKYNCTECSQKYANKRSLNNHMRFVHAGEVRLKLFECDFDKCDKKYSSKCELKTHQKYSHAEVKLFECKKCSKRFSYATTLRDHLQSHEIKSYPCPVCRQEFSNRRGLSNHTRSRHKRE